MEYSAPYRHEFHLLYYNAMTKPILDEVSQKSVCVSIQGLQFKKVYD